jgi:pimeloyl-ACP methyl ester carboxylesterase
MIPFRMVRHPLTALAVAATLACASPPAVPVVPPPAALAVTTALAAAPDQYFTSADARLRFRDIGRGEPVVLLHGLTRSLEEWIGVGDSLALTHRVIALDLRGFGQSTRFADPARFGSEMAADIVRLLDHLGLRRAHLAGHSLGAIIAAKVAQLHPDRVSSLSLIAGPFYDETTAFARDSSGFAADVEQGRGMKRFLRWLFPTYPDSVIAAFDAETMRKNDPATIGAVMRSLGDLLVSPRTAGTVRVPSLVAVGTGDPLLAKSRWLASWWPRAHLLEVPDADHITILHHPQVLTEMRVLMRERRAARGPSLPLGLTASLLDRP